jgi:hypothetical protein
MTKIVVTIITRSEKDKSDMKVIETDNMTSAIRIAHTFKPKRGYKVAKVLIEEVETLI